MEENKQKGIEKKNREVVDYFYFKKKKNFGIGTKMK